jgi:hypothetical protein
LLSFAVVSEKDNEENDGKGGIGVRRDCLMDSTILDSD